MSVYEDDGVAPYEEPFYEAAEDKANAVLRSIGGSIFFPTFRRIEGGFSTHLNRSLRVASRLTSDIDEALSSLSKKLSNDNHIFVSAISTQDIISLLLKRYAEFSEQINKFQSDISKKIIEKIKSYERSDGEKRDADKVLYETRIDIEDIEKNRNVTMPPP